MWTERFRGKEESKAKKDYDLLVREDEKKGVGLEPAVKSFEKKYNVKVKVEEVQMTKQIEKLRLDGPSWHRARCCNIAT